MILLLLATASGLKFRLAAGQKECFGFTIAMDNPCKALGRYETSGSSHEGEGVHVIVRKSYDGEEVFTGNSPGSGKIETRQEVTGTFELCFYSIIPSAEQTVSFNLHIDGSARSIVTTAHTDKVQLLVAELEAKAASIADQQQFAISRESVHRQTAESTQSRLIWWTFLEALCLVILACFQIYYLKSFFEVKVHV